MSRIMTPDEVRDLAVQRALKAINKHLRRNRCVVIGEAFDALNLSGETMERVIRKLEKAGWDVEKKMQRRDGRNRLCGFWLKDKARKNHEPEA